MKSVHWQSLAVMAAAILLVESFDSTIASILNPVLSPLGLSYPVS